MKRFIDEFLAASGRTAGCMVTFVVVLVAADEYLKSRKAEKEEIKTE